MSDRSDGVVRAMTRERHSDLTDLVLTLFWIAPAVACMITVDLWLGLVLTILGVLLLLHARYVHEQAGRDRDEQRAGASRGWREL